MSTSSDNTHDPAAAASTDPSRPYAGRVSDAEYDALQTRRALNGTETADDGGTPLIGLALSGGGIRSATFCLGLLRGLARRGLLKRFDYLSTVSGGGYIGAMFARLVCVLGIDRAQALLARSDSIPLSWLRRYGRYLAPMGARDFGIGIATYLRAIIAVHLEFAMMAMVVGLLATSAYTLDAQVGVLDARAWSAWGSAWWPLAAACWLALAPGLLVLYWMVRVGPSSTRATVVEQSAMIGRGDGLLIILAVVAGAVLVWGWGGSWFAMQIAARSGTAFRAWSALPGPTWSLAAGISLLGIGAVGACVGLRLSIARRKGHALSLSVSRKALTEWLRRINLVALLLAALGLLDWLSWELHKMLSASSAGLFGGLGLGGALLLAVRGMSEPLQRTIQSSEGARGDLLPKLVNIAGYVLAFGLVLLWTTLVQHLVYGGFSLGACPARFLQTSPQLCNALVSSAGWRWALVAMLPLAWFFATGWNADNANASSLHNMYAARLARAYLGAANAERFGGEAALQASATDTSPEALSDVTAVDDSDDVPLRAHRPTEHGGPIHLINVCLNQTRGHQTRLYNADRKGVPMVLSGYGIDVGHKPLREDVLDRVGGLARWVGISGAAASPGAGVNTTPGWAALLFLAGARLGYWLNLGDAWTALERGAAARAPGWWEGCFAKMSRLYAEFRAAYPGPLAPDWYLSDGGHFDNTGVHPLLQRQLDLIVLADCGADPKFEYADLENLVRKARIDFGAEIEFYEADEATRRFGPSEGGFARLTYLSPQQLVSNTTARGVLLARILYRADARGHRREGTLLVFKPNLHTLLDVDILAYAKRRSDFPQQSTGDQFFDEAQWESYHRLGEDFGSELDLAMLARLPGWSKSMLLPPERQTRIATSSLSKPDDAPKPFWKMETRQAAVGALSLGALIAVLTPVWQAFDGLRSEQARNREALGKTLAEVEGIFQDTSRQLDRHRAYQTMLDRLGRPAGEACDAEVEGSIAAFRAFDRYVNSDPKIGPLLKDIAPVLEDLRNAVNAPEPDAATLATALDKLAWLLRLRQSEHAVASRYSDQLVVARFRARADELDGASTEVRVAREFMVWAQGMCGDDVQSALGALCGQLRKSGATRSADDAYWRRLRPEGELVTDVDTKTTAQRVAIGTCARPASRGGVAVAMKQPEPNVQVPRLPYPDLAAACGAGTRQLYAHVHDEASRGLVAGLGWQGISPFVKVQGVENVRVSAAARGEAMPDPHPLPTLVVHDLLHDLECATELANWIVRQPYYQASGQSWAQFRIRALPRGYVGRPGVIELWWPPQDAQAGIGANAGP